METRTRSNDAVTPIEVLFGALVFFPLTIAGFIIFRKLKRAYLESPAAQRAMDISRLVSTLVGGGVACVFGTIIALICISAVSGTPPFIAVLLQTLIAVLFLGTCYIIASHLAVLYLGIVADKGKDALIFPYDMQSYTLADYFSLRIIKDYCNADKISLSAITKLTRGHGKELYAHGAFGSRRITMSSKQKRDECLAMIQAITGKQDLLITEFEG